MIYTHKYPNLIAYFQQNLVTIALEYIFAGITVPPFLDSGAKNYDYQQEAIKTFHFLSFFKLYFAIQYVKNASPLNSPNGRFIGSITNVDYSTLFLLKAWLEVNPVIALIFALLIIVVMSSYLMFIIEREAEYPDNPTLDARHENFFNTL